MKMENLPDEKLLDMYEECLVVNDSFVVQNLRDEIINRMKSRSLRPLVVDPSKIDFSKPARKTW